MTDHDEPEDHTLDVPRPVAALTFRRGVELSVRRGVGSADEVFVRHVAGVLDRIFAVDAALEAITASIDGGGTWSSPVPGVVDALSLVFGPRYVTRAAYHPYGRGVLVAWDAAEALAADLEEFPLDDGEPPGVEDGVEVVF